MNFDPGKAPVERLVPNPKAKLREQFHEVARYRQLSLRTEEAYWDWIHRFLLYWKEKAGDWRHPGEMGAEEVRAFLTYLAAERRVAVSTQNQALNGLVFLYQWSVVGGQWSVVGGQWSDVAARAAMFFFEDEEEGEVPCSVFRDFDFGRKGFREVLQFSR